MHDFFKEKNPNPTEKEKWAKYMNGQFTEEEIQMPHSPPQKKEKKKNSQSL